MDCQIRFAQDAAGNLLTSGTVEVRDLPGLTLSAIYSTDSLSDAKANSFALPGTGEIKFFARNGKKQVTVTTPSGTFVLSPIQFSAGIRAGISSAQGAATSADEMFFDTTTAALYHSDGAGTWTLVSALGNDLIINGGMDIDQRNAGASLPLTNSENYGADRFPSNKETAGAGTIQQVAATGAALSAGLVKALKWTTTTGTAPSISNNNYIQQKIEGLNISDLRFGFSDAKSITLGFFVNSSLVGTHSVALNNSALNRSYIATYTVNVANTDEYKTVTIPGDVTGTWLTGNNIGLRVIFDMGHGSSFESTAGSWQAGVFRRTAGSVKVVGTSGATFTITGLTLHRGSVAVPFKREPIHKILEACQRYYEKSFIQTAAPAQNNANGYRRFIAGKAGAASQFDSFSYRAIKRAAPTVIIFNPFAANAQVYDSSIGASCSATTVGGFESICLVSATGNAGTAVGNALDYAWSADAEL